MEVEYARRGVANAGLTTGIIGTALGVLNGGGGLLGGWGRGNGDCGVSHYELTQESAIAAKDARIALLEANTYNDQKLLDVYKYFDGELKDVRNQLCHQAVVNSQVISNLSCLQGQVATLSGLTKTVIPIDSICPDVMRRYNTWVAPTAVAPDAAAATT